MVNDRWRLVVSCNKFNRTVSGMNDQRIKGFYMTFNVYILVLNRALAVIMYRTNLQSSLTATFSLNNIV